MKETWDAKQLVPYIAGPYNQPKAGVENVRSMKYKVKIREDEMNFYTYGLLFERQII